MEISGHIYPDRPELKATSKRLGGHLPDHQNPRSALGSPKDYAPVDTRNVTVSSAYVLGGKDAQTILTLCTHAENDPDRFFKTRRLTLPLLQRPQPLI